MSGGCLPAYKVTESVLWVGAGRILWAVTSSGTHLAVGNCILKVLSATRLRDFFRKCPDSGSCEHSIQQIVTAIIILRAVECHRLVSAMAWGRALPVVADALLEKYKSYQVTTWIGL